MDWREVPALVRHSTLAIYNKSTGGGADGFIKALRISRDTLAKHGYLYSGQGLAVLEGILLTSKGWIRNKKHEEEGRSGEQKDRQFASLWKMIEPRMAELDGPSRKKPAPPKTPQQAAEMERESYRPGENIPASAPRKAAGKKANKTSLKIQKSSSEGSGRAYPLPEGE
jgi:hypothetical protein